MGYLTLATDLPDMNKVVISVWFRIPTAALVARQAEAPVLFWDFDVMLNIIPILAFGDQIQGTVYQWNTEQVGEDKYKELDFFPLPVYGVVLGDAHTAPMSPSWIGINAGGFGNPPILAARLQTSSIATGTGLSASITGYTPPNPFDVPIPPPGGTFTSEDTSWATLAAPVWFGQESNTIVEPDVWHHLLMSWDLQGSNSAQGNLTTTDVATWSKMWCALDDENKTETDLPAFWFGGGPNDIICSQVANAASSSNTGVTTAVFFSPGSLARSPLDIPAKPIYDQQPTGSGEDTIPPTTRPVERIEMAELQIFYGVTLDTAITANRRAFVAADGTPAEPELAEKLLGRRPHVLLHGTSNWRAGNNTGSLGVTDDGTLIPSGQFTPTGTIDPYKPDPSLHGPQAPTPEALQMRRKAGPVRLTKRSGNARL